MKRNVLLLLMLILLSLLLTGCYKEVDPWPASVPVSTDLPPTAVPTQAVTVVPPTAAAMPPSPVPTQAVSEADEEVFQTDEESIRVPGGDMDPGFNG